MRNTQTRTLQSFAEAEDGTIAIIFGLTIFIAMLITGLAVDIGRVMHAERKLASAVDSAALAAAKAMRDGGMSDAQAQAVAQRYFHENMTGSGGDYAQVRSVNVHIDHARNAVSIDVDASVKTMFGGVAGIDTVSFPKSATALYDSKDIELGLQLDVTGSMRGRKLQDLKDAVAGTNGLLEILLPTNRTTNKVRIGFAPYASGVNGGAYAKAVSNNRAGSDGCVYERHDLTQQNTDLAPMGATLSMKAKSELTGRGIGACPTDAKVIPMTDDRETLRREINSWNVSTSTAGHLGTAWAWYLLSPEWSSIWPAASAPVAYGDRRTMKVAILMTDGIYNTVAGLSDGDYGSTAAQSTRIAKDTCAAMKAKGITVYTVGFEAPRDAKQTLIDCASDPSKFFDAQDGDALRASFREIANEINNLRLSS